MHGELLRHCATFASCNGFVMPTPTIVCVLYAFVGVQGAILTTFISALLRDCGLSTAGIGEALTVATIASIVISPIAGGISDAFSAHGLVFRLATGLNVVPVALLSLLIASCVTDSRRWDSVARMLPVSRDLAVVCSIFLTAVMKSSFAPLLDASTAVLFEFGSIRQWLSVGMATSCLATGFAISYWDNTAVTVPLIISSLVVAGAGYAHAKDVALTLSDCTEDQVERSPSGRSNYGLFLSVEWLFFLLVAAAGGMGSATYDTYLVLWLHDEGAHPWLIGCVGAIGCSANALAFRYSRWALTKMGAHWLLVFALGVYVLRATCYAFVPQGKLAYVTAIQLLHGFNHSWFVAAATEYTKCHATPNTQVSGPADVTM